MNQQQALAVTRPSGAAIALILTALLGLAACGNGAEGPGERAETLTEEEQLYQDGRRQSRSCMGCHGPEGISRVSSYPSLAGLPQEYLASELRAYRDGEKENPMMSSVARSLSDDVIEALSHYYASLPGPEES